MNRSLIKTTLLALIAISSFAAGLFGQSEVIVRVVEDATNASLEGATVEIPELNIRRATDRAGRLTLKDVPEGEFTLEISYRGLPDYSQTFNVTSGEITALPVRLGAPQSASGVDGPVFELEEFVVTSTLSSDDIAQQIERSAINVKDLIASDTMGQVPDRTVADAVRRLPGISVERGGDQAQNEYVTIRGLNSDFNKVTIDGVAVTVGNADGASRSVPLNVISTGAVDAIEVTKSATPDMDGDAIGGTINIRSRNAFDYGERSASAEFSLGYNDLVKDFSGDIPTDDFFPNFDFTFTDFLNEEKTLGFSISGNLGRDNYYISEVSAGGYFQDSGLYYPGRLRFTERFEQVDRYGVSSSLEWRPDDFTRLSASYSFSRTNTEINRQRFQYFEDGGQFSLEDDGENSRQFEFFSFADKSVAKFVDTQDVHVFSLAGEKEVGDWRLNGDFGFNLSIYEEDPDETFSGTLSGSDNLYLFDSTGDPYTPNVIALDPFDTEDFNNYDFLIAAEQITIESEDTEFSFAGDAERDFTLAGQPLTLKLGAKVRLREREQDAQSRSFFSDPITPNADLIADYRADSRVDGNYGGTFYLDPDGFLDYVNSLEGSDLFRDFDGDAQRVARNSYNVEENVYAGYAQFTTKFDKLTVLAGVRVEFTDVSFDGSSIDEGTGDIESRSEGNDYVNLLPGIHFRYDATEDLILRASVNKTIARPSYRQLNPTTRISGDAITGFFIRRGNIDLDPTESWNLDLGFDYYYSANGFVSAGVFAKFMENNIYTTTRFDGLDEIVETVNAESAEVYGFEFLVDQGFSFLPSFLSNTGASFNLTLVDSKVDTGIEGRGDDTPLFGQVDTSVNASIYYRGPKLRARLSYNWTDDYLLFGGINEEDENLDAFADAYGTLDFTMGYYVTDSIEVFFEARNITDEANRGYLGNENRLSFNSFSGTTYFIGASWNL